MTDIIDKLAGISADSKGEKLRARRPVTAEHSQKSWDAIFSAETSFTRKERFAVALFVAGLHREAESIRLYGQKIDEVSGDTAFQEAVTAAVDTGHTEGPYGQFPAGPLTKEDKNGLRFKLDPALRKTLGDRLSAAFEHAHLLVFRPREANPEALRDLVEAGWTTDEIVTLSQLVSFLAYQLRVIAGLKVLAA